MYMASGFPWVDKTPRRSCHRRSHSGELNLFKPEPDQKLGYRGPTLSRKIGLSTREGHGYSTTSGQNGREIGRVSLDMPHQQLPQTQATFLDTKAKKHKPSSPGGKLASFFNSLISQALPRKKQQLPKVLAEEDSPSIWRRRRRNSTTTPAALSTRTKRTSMSDIDAISFDSCSSVPGSRTPPCYPRKPTPDIKPSKQASGVSTKGLEKGTRELKRFADEDGAESDSSSDLFELNRHGELGYCGGGLPVYESTHMDSIKLSSGASTTKMPKDFHF